MRQDFDKSKALNALLYVVNRIDRKDFHKIFKILYFADRQHLANWGRSITGDTYIAMEAGPVPSRIYDMLKIVRGDSYMEDVEGLSSFFTVDHWMFVNPLSDADLKKLSKSEMAELDDSIKRYGSLPYEKIKELSHDVAWQATERDFAIKWEDIAREAGLTDEEINYLNEYNQLRTALN